MKTPHFLRFAQSLALGVGMAALAGCGSTTTPDASTQDVAANDSTTTNDASSNDVASSDAAEDVISCASCECTGLVPPDVQVPDSGLPACTGEALGRCCAAVGPLPPPELNA
jgi:hypothetical protein